MYISAILESVHVPEEAMWSYTGFSTLFSRGRTFHLLHTQWSFPTPYRRAAMLTKPHKLPSLWHQTQWVQTLPLPLIVNCVVSGSSPKLSEPQFPHLSHWDGGLHVIMKATLTVKYLIQGVQSITGFLIFLFQPHSQVPYKYNRERRNLCETEQSFLKWCFHDETRLVERGRVDAIELGLWERVNVCSGK